MPLPPIPSISFQAWTDQEAERKRRERLAQEAATPDESTISAPDQASAPPGPPEPTSAPIPSSPFQIDVAPPENLQAQKQPSGALSAPLPEESVPSVSSSQPEPMKPIDVQAGQEAEGAMPPGPFSLDVPPPEQNQAQVPDQTPVPAPAPSPFQIDVTPPSPMAAIPSPRPAGDLVPNQFGDPSLSYAEAQAACGPAAAIAFARANGRNPTLREALDIAKSVGWTTEGMGGPGNQLKLLQQMGIPARMETGADWAKIQADVQGGNPVTISTPAHYFVATAYDPATGKYDFQSSGKVVASLGGSQWMTPEEMTRVSPPQATLYLDNPATPTPSIAVSSTPPSGTFQSFSPFDEVFKKYAGPYQDDPQFLAIVAAGTKAESGWNPNNQTGDQGRSWGLFQMHEAGAGAGLGAARLDPEVASSVMVPKYAEGYRIYTRQGLTGAALASAVAAYAERPQDWDKPASAARQRYANAYQQVTSGAGYTPPGPGLGSGSSSSSLTPTAALAPYQPSPLEADYLARLQPAMQRFTERTGVAPPAQVPLPYVAPPDYLPPPGPVQLHYPAPGEALSAPGLFPPRPTPVLAPASAPEAPPSLDPYDPRGVASYDQPTSVTGPPPGWEPPLATAAIPPPSTPTVGSRTLPGGALEETYPSMVRTTGTLGQPPAPVETIRPQQAGEPTDPLAYLRTRLAAYPENPARAAAELAAGLGGDIGAGLNNLLTQRTPFGSLEEQLRYRPDINRPALPSTIPGATVLPRIEQGLARVLPTDGLGLGAGVAAAGDPTNYLGPGLLKPIGRAVLGRTAAEEAARMAAQDAARGGIQDLFEESVRQLDQLPAPPIPRTLPAAPERLALPAARPVDLNEPIAATGQVFTRREELLTQARALESQATEANRIGQSNQELAALRQAQELRAEAEAIDPLSMRPGPDNPIPLYGPEPSDTLRLEPALLPAGPEPRIALPAAPERLALPPARPPVSGEPIPAPGRIATQYEALQQQARALESQAAEARRLGQSNQELAALRQARSLRSQAEALDPLRIEHTPTLDLPAASEDTLRVEHVTPPVEVNDPLRLSAEDTQAEIARLRQENAALRGEPVPAPESPPEPVRLSSTPTLVSEPLAPTPPTPPAPSIPPATPRPATPRPAAPQPAGVFTEPVTPIPARPAPTPRPLPEAPPAPSGPDVLAVQRSPVGTVYEYRVAPSRGGAYGKYQVQMRAMRPEAENPAPWETAMFGNVDSKSAAERRLGERLAAYTDSSISYQSKRAEEAAAQATVLREGEAQARAEQAMQAQATQQSATSRRAQIDQEAASLKLKQTEVPVALRGDQESRIAKGPGAQGLVIIKRPVEPGSSAPPAWDLIHQASGMRVASGFSSQREARVGLSRIAPLADWTKAPEELTSALTQEVKQSVRSIAADVYRDLPGDLPSRPPGPSAEEFAQAVGAGPRDEPYYTGIPPYKGPSFKFTEGRPDPVPPSPNPGSIGAWAVDQAKTTPSTPPSGFQTPGGHIQALATGFRTLLTNDKASLENIQAHALRAWHSVAGAAADLPPWLHAVNLDRLSGGSFYPALLRVQGPLQKAYDHAGKEGISGLKELLVFRDNLDKARAAGSKASQAVLNKTFQPSRALASDLNRAQQSLVQLQRQATPNAARVAAAQKRLTSLQRQQVRQEARWQARQQAQAASQGAQVQQGHLFSGNITEQTSREGLRDLESRYSPQTWQRIQEAADQVDEYVKNIRSRLVESGVISPELGQELEQNFPHYIPTNILDHLADPANIATGRSINLRDSGLRQLTPFGTGKGREDVTKALARLAFETERRAAKNETAAAVWGWRSFDSDLAGLMREVASGTSPERHEFAMHFFDNGVKKELLVDKSLAPALQFPTSTGSSNLIIRGMEKAASLTRATATTFNPSFALVRNPILDTPAYLHDSLSRYGVTNLPEIIKTLATSYGDAFKGLMRNEFQGAQTQRLLQGGAGQFGYFGGTQKELEQLRRVVEQGGGYLLENPKDAMRFLVHMTPSLGERAELAPRVAAMRLAENIGDLRPVRSTRITASGNRITTTVMQRVPVSYQEALIRALDVTMDFSRGGQLTKQISAVVPFFNVNTQTLPWLIRTFERNPKGAAMSLASLVMTPVVATEAWNRADPGRAKAYDDVPDYIKRQGLVIMAADPNAGVDEQGNPKYRYAVIPLRNFGSVAIPVREALARTMGAVPGMTGNENPRAWQEILADVIGSSSPIPADNPQQAVGAFLPAVGGTLLQLLADKDFFRGTMIASEKGNERSTSFSKFAAQGLQKIPEDVPALGGLSAAQPSQVEFAIRDVANGVGGMFLAAADLAARAKSGQPLTAYNPSPGEVPGVGALTGNFLQSRGGYQNRQLSLLRDKTAKLMGQDFKQALREGNPGLPPDQRTALDEKVAGFAGRLATMAVYGTKENPDTQIQRIQKDPGFIILPVEEQAKLLAQVRQEFGSITGSKSEQAQRMAQAQQEATGIRYSLGGK